MRVTRVQAIQWLRDEGFKVRYGETGSRVYIGSEFMCTVSSLIPLIQRVYDAGYTKRDVEFGESEVERCPGL